MTAPITRLPRPTTKCARSLRGQRCAQRYDSHKGGMCPDGRGRFQWQQENATRQGDSFGEHEIAALAHVFEALATGKPVSRAVVRSQGFADLARKALAMAARSKAAKAARKAARS